MGICFSKSATKGIVAENPMQSKDVISNRNSTYVSKHGAENIDPPPATLSDPSVKDNVIVFTDTTTVSNREQPNTVVVQGIGRVDYQPSLLLPTSALQQSDQNGEGLEEIEGVSTPHTPTDVEHHLEPTLPKSHYELSDEKDFILDLAEWEKLGILPESFLEEESETNQWQDSISSANDAPSAQIVFDTYSSRSVSTSQEVKEALHEYIAACCEMWDMVRKASESGADKAFSANNDIQSVTSLEPKRIHEISCGAADDESSLIAKKKHKDFKRSDPLSEEYLDTLHSRASNIVKAGISNVNEPINKGDVATQEGVNRQVITANSFIDTSEMLYVRVWKNRRECRKFQNALRVLSHSRHQLQLPPVFCVPHSTTMAYQGRLVTVTWLVPLVANTHLEMDKGGVVAQVEECWRVAMGVPLTAPRLPMYAGSDGRYYAIGVDEVFYHRLPAPRFPWTTDVQRTEYGAYDMFKEMNGRKKTNVTHLSASFSRVIYSVYRLISGLDTLSDTDPKLFSNLFRNAGLNMHYLYAIREQVNVKFPSSSEGETNDNYKIKYDNYKKCRFIALLDEEMVCRTALQMFETSLYLADVKGKCPAREALKVINNVVKELTSKSYFMNDLMLLLRLKFRTPPTFSINYGEVNIINVFLFVADKLGLIFDKQVMKYVDFDEPVVLSHTARDVLNLYSGNDPAPYMKLLRNWSEINDDLGPQDHISFKTVSALMVLSFANYARFYCLIIPGAYVSVMEHIKKGFPEKMESNQYGLPIAVIGDNDTGDSLARDEIRLLSNLPVISFIDAAYVCNRCYNLELFFRLNKLPLSIIERARLLKSWSSFICAGHEVFKDTDSLWHCRRTAFDFLLFSTTKIHINKIVTDVSFVALRRDIVMAMLISVSGALEEGSIVKGCKGATVGNGQHMIVVRALQMAAAMILVNFGDVLDETFGLCANVQRRMFILVDAITNTGFSIAMGLSVLIAHKLMLWPVVGGNMACSEVQEEKRTDVDPELISRVEIARKTFEILKDVQKFSNFLYDIGGCCKNDIVDLRDYLINDEVITQCVSNTHDRTSSGYNFILSRALTSFLTQLDLMHQKENHYGSCLYGFDEEDTVSDVSNSFEAREAVRVEGSEQSTLLPQSNVETIESEGLVPETETTLAQDKRRMEESEREEVVIFEEIERLGYEDLESRAARELIIYIRLITQGRADGSSRIVKVKEIEQNTTDCVKRWNFKVASGRRGIDESEIDDVLLCETEARREYEKLELRAFKKLMNTIVTTREEDKHNQNLKLQFDKMTILEQKLAILELKEETERKTLELDDISERHEMSRHTKETVREIHQKCVDVAIQHPLNENAECTNGNAPNVDDDTIAKHLLDMGMESQWIECNQEEQMYLLETEQSTRNGVLSQETDVRQDIEKMETLELMHKMVHAVEDNAKEAALKNVISKMAEEKSFHLNGIKAKIDAEKTEVQDRMSRFVEKFKREESNEIECEENESRRLIEIQNLDIMLYFCELHDRVAFKVYQREHSRLCAVRTPPIFYKYDEITDHDTIGKQNHSSDYGITNGEELNCLCSPANMSLKTPNVREWEHDSEVYTARESSFKVPRCPIPPQVNAPDITVRRVQYKIPIAHNSLGSNHKAATAPYGFSYEPVGVHPSDMMTTYPHIVGYSYDDGNSPPQTAHIHQTQTMPNDGDNIRTGGAHLALRFRNVSSKEMAATRSLVEKLGGNLSDFEPEYWMAEEPPAV